MCAVCDMKSNIGEAFVRMMEDISSLGEIAIDAVGLLVKLKERGVVFDSEEETLYSKLLEAMQPAGVATGDGTGEALPAIPDEVKESIVNAVAEKTGISKDRIFFCDSAEQAEAMAEKIANGEKVSDKKPH